MNQNPDDLRTAGLHRGPDHVDYRETSDLTNVHAAVQREHSVGTPGAVPLPVWLMVVCGIAIFWAGASFSGGFSSSYFSADNYSAHSGQATKFGGETAQTQSAGPSQADLGQMYFEQNCATCHQDNGAGLPGQYPPLAGSEFINGGTTRLGMILLKGLQGPLTVRGQSFNGAMPAQGTNLTSKKIAAILTYERSSFGNHAPAVSEAEIDAARAEFAAHVNPYAPADILAVPVTSNLPGGAANTPAPAAASPSPGIGGGK
jgi:mono/diheme cytochrome c family protein